MKRGTSKVCVAAAGALALTYLGCNDNCTYAHRLYDSQCHPLTGQITKSKTPPPSCNAPGNVKVKVTSCPASGAGSATLCEPDSNGALVYAVLLPANTTAADCFDVWNGTSAGDPSIFNGLSYAGFYAPYNSTMACDASGCRNTALDSCFVTYDADGNQSATVVSAGTYKLCYIIDSYNTVGQAVPVVMGSDSSNGYQGIAAFFGNSFDPATGAAVGPPYTTASFVGTDPATTSYCAAPAGTCPTANYDSSTTFQNALARSDPNPVPPAVPGNIGFQSLTVSSLSGIMVDLNQWTNLRR